MQKYQAFDPKSEVMGQSMLGFILCIRREEIMPFLEMHGLNNIKPDGWYPLQKWLDVLSNLAEERPGQAMFDFMAVGMRVSEMTPFSPEIEARPFPDVLMALDEVYQAIHRGNAGGSTFERVGSKHIKVVNKVPYPDDFMYGANYGMVRRFIGGKPFTVYYDPDIPRREQGGEQTVVHITWE